MKIAIDGPAASGKSTAAKLLARRLDFLYIDTGAMYRAVTLEGLRRRINFEKNEEITAVAGVIDIDLRQDSSIERGYRVFTDGEEVTGDLFTPEVDSLVSVVARVPEVRRLLAQAQRKLAQYNDVVMAGRDIGSNVLPDAELKIFLTADTSIRAIRRQKELEDKGQKKLFAEILGNIRQRDEIDSSRSESPLIKPEDALTIDCSDLSIPRMVEIIEEAAQKKLSEIKNIQI